VLMAPLRAMFRSEDFPQIVSGLKEADDAAVYRISDTLSLVFTTDFFTPIVDDPYEYGAIAAANAMSDIYAMGGEVVLALNIAGFPEKLPEEMARQVLIGGGEKVLEAGGAIAGGHTIDSDEPIYGLAVMGKIESGNLLEKSRACVGDVVFLTKPLGTGIVTTAFKGDAAEDGHIQAATKSMMILNRKASELAMKHHCHAATDVTGFSLMGHGLEISDHSNVCLDLNFAELPFLPGARDYATQWLFPVGSGRNQNAFQEKVEFNKGISEEDQRLLFTPETSGGLLLTFDPVDADCFLEDCIAADQWIWKVGVVSDGDTGTGIRVR